MTVLVLIVAAVLMATVMIAISNALFFIRLHNARTLEQGPNVSVLIPARNEAHVIGLTLAGLRRQTYSRFEVIVLDDDSTDGTAEIVGRVSREDRRFRVVSGGPLPDGWTGKNWACHQLGRLARGTYLVFSDADVRWAPGALAAVVAVMTSQEADALAVWPKQITETWAERLVVPLMAMTVLGYLPCLFVHYLPFDSMAAAIGQCLVFRRQAYDQIGGHESVRSRVLDDVLLVRRIKAHGFRLRTADASGLLSCRMYHDWREVRNGFAKNILAGHGNSIVLLGCSAVFHWMVFLLPWVWLAAGWVGGGTGWPLLPLGLIALGVGVRSLTAATSGQRVGDALLLPVSILLMTWIAGQAVWWRWRYRAVQWKGRVVGGDST